MEYRYQLRIIFILLALLVCSSLVESADNENSPRKGAAKRKRQRVKGGAGNCAHLWRPDNLPGKCFGLRPYNEYEELREIKKVMSAPECKSLCCVLGEQCVTWQYQNATAKCSLGPAVRLGFEGADTPNWCDPHPPGKWNGNRLLERKQDGSCSWGPDLTTQCFGLGPEHYISNKEKLNTDQCREACCADKTCEVYQEMPGRGCYYNVGTSVWCSKAETEFIGGRKCIPGFCGGMEKEILGRHKGAVDIEPEV